GLEPRLSAFVPETAQSIGGRDALRGGEGAARVRDAHEPRSGESVLFGELAQKRAPHLAGSGQRGGEAGQSARPGGAWSEGKDRRHLGPRQARRDSRGGPRVVGWERGLRVADATTHLPANRAHSGRLPQELAPQRELPPAGCPGFEGPFPQPVLMSCALSSSPGEDGQTERKRASTTRVDAHICPT